MATNRKDMPQHYFTLEEYFALEQASEARWEYWDGELVCMSGGKQQHYIISGNLYHRLSQQLGDGCRAFTGDTPIWTPTLLPYHYPDASVACGELRFQPIHGIDALINPVLIVEVLSPTTASRDFEAKFTAYKAIATFREYLLIAQDAPRVIHFTRRADGEWAREEVTGLDATLTLDSINGRLALGDVYKDVKFD